jgi:hypothetical protein
MSTEKPCPIAEEEIFPGMPRAHDYLQAVEATALGRGAGRQ